MFKNLLRGVLMLSLTTTFPTFAMDKFVIDTHHSYVLWHVNHLGFSTQSGKWFVNGTLYYDKQNPQNSKVNVTINVASLVTGDPELDTHLKSKEFFDVGRYPVATFKSEKVELSGQDSANVSGVLTLHGVSKPVNLAVKFNKEGMNPIYNRKTLGFTASTEIKRSEFGITNFVPQVSDKVRIEINAEAYLPKA